MIFKIPILRGFLIGTAIALYLHEYNNKFGGLHVSIFRIFNNYHLTGSGHD